MKHSAMLRAVFIITISLTSFILSAQDCSVDNDALRGIYTGDCKNGKANGKGKATGTDSYEGDFKSGLPDGQGTYRWANGNSYTGKFTKGMKDGKGMLVCKRVNAGDSVVDGYWKKDKYTGKYEKPYAVYFQSKAITAVEIELKKSSFKQVSFFISNTSGGGASLEGGELPKMKVDDIQLVKGNFGRSMSNSDHVKKTEMILYDVVFPIRMKMTIGSEQLDVEFNEEGNYMVNVRINQ